MDNLPEELKSLKRYLREAKKVEKASPIVAYYCRLYAIQEGLKSPENQKNPTTKKWLTNEISNLEKMKKNDIKKEEAKEKILTMANGIFAHADQIDRAGNADKNTAAAFNSAFVFYEILKYFGPRDETTNERSKYCMFKTTDILKALKEGRKPNPGPPVDENDEELNAELRKIGGNDEDGNDNNNNNNHNDDDDHKINNNNNNNKFGEEEEDNNNLKGGGGGNYDYGNEDNNNDENDDNNNNDDIHEMNKNSFNSFNNQQPHKQQPFNPNFQMPYNNNFNIPPSSQPKNNINNNNNKAPPLQPWSEPDEPQYNYVKKTNFAKFESKIIACAEAEKITKEAFSALRFNDVDTAAKKLEEALEILNQFR